jgi:F-type H+-transporting ATPase subunit b
VNNPLVQPDPGLYIWTILTFLVLAGLLAKFAWRPLLDALERRRQTIAAAVDDARRAKEELERVQQDAAALVAQARRESDGIVSRARADAERLREELREKAAADAAVIKRQAERQIQQETARALQQIRQEAVELSVAIASKLLHRTVSATDNERLLQDAVAELETTTRSGQ